MTSFLAWAALAAATPLEAFPLRADVTLPAEGPARIAVPLAMRSLADPEEGTDLLLVNGVGDEIPFLRLEGSRRRYVAVASVVAPTDDPSTLEVTPTGRVDRLRVTLPPRVVVATVEVRVGDAVVAGPTRVYRTGDGEVDAVDVPGLEVPFTVVVTPRREGALDSVAPSVATERGEGLALPPEVVDLPLAGPRLQENGWARWQVALDRPLPLDRLVVRTSERALDRAAGLSWRPLYGDVSVVFEPEPDQRGRLLRRMAGDDVTESPTLLAPPGTPSDALLLFVQVEGQAVPVLTGVSAQVDAVELFVPEPGPGPHVLLAGAVPGTSPRWDRVPGDEALVEAAPRVVPAPPVPNPSFTPITDRAELVRGGPAPDRTAFATARDVTGEGLVRIPLPAEVVAHARPDLADLRLVDARERQIPYLVRRARREAPLAVEAEPDDRRPGHTRVRLTLPEANLPSVVLSVTSPATVFSRRVTVWSARGGAPLRTVRWTADGAPGRLVLELPGPVTDALILDVDDGDNGPLALGPVEAWTDGPELLAVLPEGGASLWYGAPTMAPPDYDLQALDQRWRVELLARADAEATLGEPRSLAAARLGWLDRVLLGGGLAVFAVGLLLLLVDLLRALPPPPSAAAPPPPAPDPGPPPDAAAAPPVAAG